MSFRQPSPVAVARARATLEASRVSDQSHPAIAMLAATWEQIAGVCADLSDGQWLAATDCPGWTVMDQIAHIIGTERTLLGDPLPRDPVVANHVKNELGAFNEAWVEHYRGWQGPELLREFGHYTGERLEAMRRLQPGDLSKETITPLGILAIGDFLNVRVVDCFIHEQDIRRALGRPGDLDSDVARFVVGEAMAAMPKAVARGAHAPEGSSVVFDIDGPAGMIAAVGVAGDRGGLLSEIPAAPTVTIDLDTETFLLLGTGRISGKRAFDEARVGLEGDTALGRTVVGAMNFLF